MIIPPPPTIVVREPAAVVTLPLPPTKIVIEAKQGLQGLTGPMGPTGEGAEITVIATAPVSGHRVVGYNNAGDLRHASCIDLDYFSSTLGLTLNAALPGESVTVATNREVAFSGWNWVMGGAIFLSVDGEMIQVPPTTAFLLQVGFPTAPDKMWVEVQIGIVL